MKTGEKVTVDVIVEGALKVEVDASRSRKETALRGLETGLVETLRC